MFHLSYIYIYDQGIIDIVIFHQEEFHQNCTTLSPFCWKKGLDGWELSRDRDRNTKSICNRPNSESFQACRSCRYVSRSWFYLYSNDRRLCFLTQKLSIQKVDNNQKKWGLLGIWRLRISGKRVVNIFQSIYVTFEQLIHNIQGIDTSIQYNIIQYNKNIH